MPFRYCLHCKNIKHIYAELVSTSAINERHNIQLMRIMPVVVADCVAVKINQ